MNHAHVTSWFIAILLFVWSYYLQKNGKEKTAKISKMMLRLFYILILATGGHLFGIWISALGAKIISSLVFLKVLVGLWVIGAMELILARQSKGQSTNAIWIQFIIALLLAMILGWVLI